MNPTVVYDRLPSLNFSDNRIECRELRTPAAETCMRLIIFLLKMLRMNARRQLFVSSLSIQLKPNYDVGTPLH